MKIATMHVKSAEMYWLYDQIPFHCERIYLESSEGLQTEIGISIHRKAKEELIPRFKKVLICDSPYPI